VVIVALLRRRWSDFLSEELLFELLAVIITERRAIEISHRTKIHSESDSLNHDEELFTKTSLHKLFARAMTRVSFKDLVHSHLLAK
jgi:hypothetical protein